MVANARSARAQSKHSRPYGPAPREYPNWNADEGIWYNDDGIPQPSPQERAAETKRALRQRKLLVQLAVLANGAVRADSSNESDDDDLFHDERA